MSTLDHYLTSSGGKLLNNLLLFGRLCKALGMDINPNRMMDVAHALELIDLANKQDFYHALRASMVTRQRDLALFDEAFKRFWRMPVDAEWQAFGLQLLEERPRRHKQTRVLPPPDAEPFDPDADNSEKPIDPDLIAVTPTVSQQETLRHKDFAQMTGEEILAARHMMEQLAWSLGVRRTRRFRAGKGQSLDTRRVFRRNVRYAGELLDLPERAPKIKPRRLVLICDVSGSMERYTRLLLHFVHTLAHSIYQVESFVFSTRLSRVTLPLRHRSVDEALRDVGATVNHWGSGTRIDNALRDFNYHWSRRVLGQGAVVLLITDGWDRGEPEVLSHEAERLQKSCYRLIWLNPLIGGVGYQPLTRGCQALLPYVDDFLPVRSLANLEALGRELLRLDWRRPERVPHRHLIEDI